VIFSTNFNAIWTKMQKMPLFLYQKNLTKKNTFPFRPQILHLLSHLGPKKHFLYFTTKIVDNYWLFFSNFKNYFCEHLWADYFSFFGKNCFGQNSHLFIVPKLTRNFGATNRPHTASRNFIFSGKNENFKYCPLLLVRFFRKFGLFDQRPHVSPFDNFPIKKTFLIFYN